MPSPPRLKDLIVFSSRPSRECPAQTRPHLKRVAPRRGDPPIDARTLERIAADFDSMTLKGQKMPKYQMALDAASQDGRWLDDPNAVTTVLKFLLSKLSPADLAELDTHLAEGTQPQATDHRLPEGDLKRKLLDYTPRNRRAMVDSLSGAGGRMSLDEMRRADPDYGKTLDERFPGLKRLKGY